MIILPVFSCFSQTPATVSAWWQQHPTPDTWPAASEQLKAQLVANYERNGVNGDFRHWLRHFQWVQLGIVAKDLLANDANRETFIALGKEPEISHLFVEKIVPANQPEQALENLLRLAQANMQDLREYPALGVAFALVFDKPFQRYWPHHQVSKEAVPIGDLDVVARFNFYVDANRRNNLAQDISKLNFDEVKFIVDTRVSLDELRYGQSNKSNRITYTNFDQAFPSIQYDRPRVYKTAKKQFDWPAANGPYTLANIEQRGGICVDQAYYAATLGKARGIPTLYFHGQGNDGGHAWFGFLQRNGKWNFDCGRYDSQNYPVGYAYDPQTWQELNDVTLQNIARNFSRDEKFEPAQTAITWAKMNPDAANYRQILKDARELMPELDEAWQLEGDWLDQHGTNAERQEFYQAWIKQFSANRDLVDLKVEGQTRLLAALKDVNDPAAEQLQKDIIMYNRKKRFDLGIGVGAGALLEKLDAKDWQAARQEYERLLRNFNQQGGGNLYYQIVRPYVMFCLEEQQIPQAWQGLKYAQNKMTYSSDSILAQEFDRLDGLIKAAQNNNGSNE